MDVDGDDDVDEDGDVDGDDDDDDDDDYDDNDDDDNDDDDNDDDDDDNDNDDNDDVDDYDDDDNDDDDDDYERNHVCYMCSSHPITCHMTTLSGRLCWRMSIASSLASMGTLISARYPRTCR